jgi:hypothetical protein
MPVQTPFALPQAKFGAEKRALIMSMIPEITSSVIGSTIAERAGRPAGPAEAEEKKELSPAERRRAVSKIKLTATDPEAQAYLEKNKAKVMAILRQMAAEGKI